MIPLVAHIQLDLNLLEYIIQGQVIATSWQICARISFEVFSALCLGSVIRARLKQWRMKTLVSSASLAASRLYDPEHFHATRLYRETGDIVICRGS